MSTDLLSEASFAQVTFRRCIVYSDTVVQAEIVRESATSSNVSLAARAGAIQAARHLAHRAEPPRVEGDRDEEDDIERPRSQSSVRSSGPFSPPLNRSTNAHAVREMLMNVNSEISGAQMHAL